MRVALETIGCRLNQAEMRSLAWELGENGVEIVRQSENCDVIVLNTCTVTAAAAADSRGRIRSLKRKNPGARVLVTGCFATMEPEAAAALAGDGSVIPNQSKETIARLILQQNNAPVSVPAHPVKPQFRRTRAFIKAQDGCSSQCAYCITTIARGKSRSTSPTYIIEQINREVHNNVKEVVLSGVQLNSYGRDLGNADLSTLIRDILHYTDIPRLRLSSLEPWGLPEALFGLWSSPRLCRHLHLPLQSGCSETLRRMRRPYNARQYAVLLQEIEQAIPGIALSTDIITGFPGENNADFSESLDFVQALNLAHGHVFSFSPRPGTAASTLPDRVMEREIKRRTHLMRAVIEGKQTVFREAALHAELEVLWEKAEKSADGGWLLSGWSDTYLQVEARAEKDLSNQICRVSITDIGQRKLLGSMLPD